MKQVTAAPKKLGGGEGYVAVRPSSRFGAKNIARAFLKTGLAK